MRALWPFLILGAAVLAAVQLDDPAPEADLVVVNRADAYTLDPQRQSYLHDFRMTYALFEGLVRWNLDDYTIEPAGAARWKISDDRRTYRFHLRTDAKWSNGRPVTAHDFTYSWMRLLLPDTAADYSNLMFCIAGAEAFWTWRTERLAEHAGGPDAGDPAAALALWGRTERRFAETVGLRAVDEHTLDVVLHRPTAYFLDLLCFAVCHPVHRPCVEGWPDVAAPPPFDERRWLRLDPESGRLEQTHLWARAGRLVGNGPYRLEQWRYKRDLRLVRNEHYHSPQLARSDSIVARTIEDANTRVLAFAGGGLDWLTEVGTEYQADMIAEAAAGERRDIHVIPAFGTDFYSFNCRPTLSDGRPNPFADRRVRQAFTMSVEKTTIVERATRLGEPVATTFIPPGSIPGYRSPDGLPHDLDRARRVLREAGWEDRDGDGVVENADGEPFPVIDLLYTTNSQRYRWISLELKAQWERALRVKVELRSTDTKFYKEDLKLGQFMIARGRWYGDYGDPTTFLDLCRSTDGNNDRGFASAAYDRMLDEAANTLDPEQRMRRLEACERLLMDEEVPLVPICQLVQVYMFDPETLDGLSTHPRLTQYLWRLKRRDEETKRRRDEVGKE